MAALAVVNGKVWGRPGATGLSVEADLISAVGAGRDMRRASRILDARGNTILPAFNDAHVHFLQASRAIGQLDLFGARTLVEVERIVAEHARTNSGPWVVGRGWMYSAFPDGMPSVALLDRLVPDRPAYIESFDAHTGWANSRALSVAGAPAGSVLKEAAMSMVTRHIPAPSEAEDLDALRAGMRLAASRGVASVQEAGDGSNQLPLWTRLREAGEMTLRVRLGFDMTPGMAIDEWVRRLEEYSELKRDGDLWLSTGILKAFADGVVESQTAAMLAPYVGSDEKGEPLWEDGDLRQAVKAADQRAWQVQVHAIGDAAIRQALDAFEGTTPGRRHRVEHIETPDPSDIPRFARLGVVASMQPQHSDPEITQTWREKIGPERARRGWPWRDLRGSGARLAFGTDWPVVPLDPLASLRIAAEKLGLETAAEAWTQGSAYAEHAEHVKGSLTEGMLADIVVVDLDESVVVATVVGGRVVYEG